MCAGGKDADMGGVKNFKGKKAAPFTKGGKRKKSSTKTAKGTKKKGR
jgi:hypothetical protein